MTDVRLTATNPEDSSVVPVACNAKGELLLEEPPLASDDYVAKTGDNMTGDLTLGTNKIKLATAGSAEFTGDVTSGGQPYAAEDIGVRLGSLSGVIACVPSSQTLFLGYTEGNSAETVKITPDGSASFAGNTSVGGVVSAGLGFQSNTYSGRAVAITTTTQGVERALAVEDGSGDYAISLNMDGSATFAGNIQHNIDTSGNPLVEGVNIYTGNNNLSKVAIYGPGNSAESAFLVYAGGLNGFPSTRASINHDGSARFASDVVVGSRNKEWMIVESNGLAHLVEQTRVSVMDDAARYPELRNIPQELDLIEKALGDVMQKLRMNPPAGWPVWDGSDEI